ncbi:MAG: Ig-like domain-containing protein [bacterium]
MKIFKLLAAVFVFLFALPANAQINAGLTQFGAQTALGDGGTGGLIGIVSNIINIALGFIGVLVLVYMLYGGFLWMTSGGEDKKVTKAKQTIVNALIGLVIVLASWGITTFIIGMLVGATGGGGGGGGSTPGQVVPTFSDTLGSGSLENHYPARKAKDIPRNTQIVITFRDPIKVDSIIEGADGLKTSSIIINPLNGPVVGGGDVTVTASGGGKTFTIRPKDAKWFGSPTAVTTYFVKLTENIIKDDGSLTPVPAFSRNGYTWDFDISTVLDVTPPKVLSVSPLNGQLNVPMNAVITVTFDEAIDPGSGTTAGAFEVIDTLGARTAVAGTVKYSNGYRTLEFVPSRACGLSSCGTTVYCLPEGGDGTDQNIEVRIKPSTLDPRLGAPTAATPHDGVTDMVGNSLDGNKNGVANGPATDLYSFTFSRDSTIRTSAPRVISVEPASLADSVNYNADIKVTFEPEMQLSTLPGNISLATTNPAGINYYLSSVDIINKTELLPLLENNTVTTVVHDIFAEDKYYQPQLKSGMRDRYQNCFVPISAPDFASPTPGTCQTTDLLPFCCPNASGVIVPRAEDGTTHACPNLP